MPTEAAQKSPETTDAPDLIAEFKRCLGTMSHSRAGWDYQLSREQRAKEDREELDALTRARAICAENPDRHDDLRAAFKDASPLAQMAEIEARPVSL
jgi:hypothetical protein